MKTIGGHLALVSVLACFPVGCGGMAEAEGGVANDPASSEPSMASIESDLSIGSQGDGVRALHAYLTRYGYFPSDKLARDYPNLVPIVPEGPAEDDVFDERTFAAVSAFQMRSDLTPSGVVDAETRARLSTSRCSFPDAYPATDSIEKFALLNSKWNTTNLRWNLTNQPTGITRAQALSAIAAAFASWHAETNLTFTETNGPADILITFGAIDGKTTVSPTILAQTAPPSGGGDMTVDSAESWSVSSPFTPSDKVDFQTVILHELGHALGLHHSSISGATMLPSTTLGTQDRTLSQDDAMGISTLYDVWQSLPGSARDIAVSGAGEVWAIGNPAASNGAGFSIYKWNGSNWTPVDGIATRIAVTGGGIPWVVDTNGVIWRRSSGDPASGSWTSLPGCGTDIGAGVQNDVWVIACDGGVHKWNYSASSWDNANGFGSRIAVARNGVPWVVQPGGQVFRRTTSSATTGSWEPLPGSASDIGAMDAVWALGRDSVSGGSSIFIWDEQQRILNPDGTVAAPGVQGWLKVSGGANNISAGRFGPWVTQTNGAVFRQSPWGDAG